MRNIIHLATDAPETLVNITEQVRAVAKASGMRNGLVSVYAQGATAAILIQENWDESVQTDVVNLLCKLIPKGVWLHDAQDGNGDAHLKSGLVGPSETVPLIEGELGLSRWQNIFFCEFDGPRKDRRVVVSVISDDLRQAAVEGVAVGDGKVLAEQIPQGTVVVPGAMQTPLATRIDEAIGDQSLQGIEPPGALAAEGQARRPEGVQLQQVPQPAGRPTGAPLARAAQLQPAQLDLHHCAGRLRRLTVCRKQGQRCRGAGVLVENGNGAPPRRPLGVVDLSQIQDMALHHPSVGQECLGAAQGGGVGAVIGGARAWRGSERGSVGLGWACGVQRVRAASSRAIAATPMASIPSPLG